MVAARLSLTTSTNLCTNLFTSAVHELHIGDISLNQLLLAQFQAGASSILKDTHQKCQIGTAPVPTTFYDHKGPPKFGWAHIFSTTWTTKFHLAQALKLDIPTNLDGANADKPTGGTYSIFKTCAIDSIGAMYNNKSDVLVVTDAIRRNANLLNRKNAYYANQHSTSATAQNETLNVTNMPFIGFFDYDDPSAISTGLLGM